MSAEPAAKPAPGAHPDDWNYWHIVGWWEHWTTTLLRRVPRALCGVRLDGGPDMPEPAEDCPACVQRNGGHALGH